MKKVKKKINHMNEKELKSYKKYLISVNQTNSLIFQHIEAHLKAITQEK